MRLHYAMWAFMGCVFFFGGAILRGQQDYIEAKAEARGATVVKLLDMSLRRLAQEDI